MNDELRNADIQGVGQGLASDVVRDLIKERRGERRWRWFKRAFYGAMTLGFTGLYLSQQAQQFGIGSLSGDSVVAVIPFEGAVGVGSTAAAEPVNEALRKAFDAKNVKAVVMRIKSPGGSPGEAERINAELDYWKKKTGKPVVAVCDGLCASAAYMVAIHADEVYAGRYTWVGSIGAILKGWDFTGIMQRFDVHERVFASGDMKDIMNPNQPLSAEQAEKVKDLVNKTAEVFYNEVKSRRAGKLGNDPHLFSGAVWLAEDALARGLVDRIGTVDEVIREKWPDSQIRTVKPVAKGGSLLSAVFGADIASLFEPRVVEMRL